MQVLPFESLVWTEHSKSLSPSFLNYILLLASICMKTIEPKELKSVQKSLYEMGEQLSELWAGKLSIEVNMKKLVK